MNYVESLDLFGTKAKEISCIKGSGAPTSSTEGAVGLLYMDINNGNIYKCISVSEGLSTWETVDVPVSTYVPVPKIIDIETNSEFKLYFRNILQREGLKFWIYGHPTMTNLESYYYDDYLLIKPLEDGVYSLPWKVFDIDSKMVDEGQININASSKVLDNIKVLVIGDSTVANGITTQELLDLYGANNKTITLLGTKGNTSNGNLHEGYSGRTSQGFCTATDNNPFYNNGFDFTYYMETQNYNNVQAVVIQLGINDIFKYRKNKYDMYNSEIALGYFEQMINSILEYDSSIKIILNLPITPNSNGTSFTQTYGTNQIYWVYNENIIHFAKDLMEKFGDNPNITISATNCILDTKTDIRDGVHPTEEGYKKLGKRLYDVLNNNVTTNLFNLSGRTVVEPVVTTAAADPHEMDSTKIYKSDFGGVRHYSYATKVGYEMLSNNSFKQTDVGGAGKGVEFPISNLESGNYVLKYNINESGLRCYILKYNSDTTFNSYETLSSTANAFIKNITLEEGYIYSILFAAVGSFPSEGGTVTNISLTKV